MRSRLLRNGGNAWKANQRSPGIQTLELQSLRDGAATSYACQWSFPAHHSGGVKHSTKPTAVKTKMNLRVLTAVFCFVLFYAHAWVGRQAGRIRIEFTHRGGGEV